MEMCDIDHLHKRFLDIWEWCERQGFDTKAFTYVENAFKSEPTVEMADCKTESQTKRPCNSCQEWDCYSCDYKQTERECE